MQLVLDSKGLTLKKKNHCFWVVGPDAERLISPGKVHSIAVTSHSMLHTSAIRLAINSGIPIYFLDALGRVEGRLDSASYGQQAQLRRSQVFFAQSTQATAWVISLFKLKNKGQIANLTWLADRHPSKAAVLQKASVKMLQYEQVFDDYANQTLDDCRQTLMGFEGNMARTYWKALSEALPAEWQFDNRNRQPAHDAFNSALNYLYGMLYATVESAAFGAGLDPNLGLLHADTYGKPTLSFDLIEVTRPLADRLLLNLIAEGKLPLNGFDKKEDKAVTINKQGKALIIPAFNNWLNDRSKFQEKISTNRLHIYRFAGALAETLKKFALVG